MTGASGEQREKDRIAEGMSEAGTPSEAGGTSTPGAGASNLEQTIRERAHTLWEADGRPEGRETEYWLRAEREVMNQSAAGEEDPLEGLTHLTPESNERSGAG